MRLFSNPRERGPEVEITDVVARIMPLFADLSKWQHKVSNHFDTDLHGPANINISVYDQAMVNAEYNLSIDRHNIKINDADRGELARFVHRWWVWNVEQVRLKSERLQRDTEARIDAHLKLYNL